MDGMNLSAGRVVYVDFGSSQGREQSGIRPAVVLSSTDFTDIVRELTIVVPCTRRDRGWRNHVQVQGPTGLNGPTFAMTEQVRSVSIDRVLRTLGSVDNDCLWQIGQWTRTWMHTAA